MELLIGIPALLALGYSVWWLACEYVARQWAKAEIEMREAEDRWKRKHG